MSVPAFAWAIEQGFLHDLKPSDRLLLQYLADQADANYDCWPGQERIRKYTGLALRTIRAGLPRLAAEGLVKLEERQGIVTRYHLNIATNGVDPAPPPRQNVTGDPGKLSPTTPANSYRVPGNEPRQSVTGTPANEHGGPRQMVTVTPANCHPDPLRDPRKKERKEDRLSASASSASEFDAFWQVYPRKVGRGTAAKAFAAACRKAPAEVIITAVQQAIWSPNPRFIPHPTTWLHGERWTDEVEHPDAALLRAVGLSPGGLLQ